MPTTRTRVVPCALAPIGLEDLNKHAALLTRVDRKYVLGLEEARRVLALVDPASRLLSIDGLDVSAYSTTYYDTPGLDAFSMTARPRRRRFKVRTRLYLDSGQAFLEVKTRGPRGTTIKERQRIAPHEAGGPLADAHREWVADRLERVGRPGAAQGMEPVLRGSYSRSTLLLPGGRARATIDSDLAWAAPDPRGRPARTLARPGLVIVETKGTATPSCLDRLLWCNGHRPTRISKYATAMAALHEELPTNRWNRVLTRHFGLAA